MASNRKGRIAYLQKVTGIGGTEQFFLQLGEGLIARGWELDFGLLHEPEKPVTDFRQELVKHGWNVEPIEIARNLSLSAPCRIRGWLKQVGPDILHTHLIHGDLYGRIASVGFDYPLLTTKHNDDAFKQFPGYRWFAQWLNNAFDAGVTISEHLKRYYRAELGVKHPDFRTIPYGLDPKQFNQETRPDPQQGSLEITDEPVCFGIVARLTEQKGHSDLIKAFKHLRSREEDIHLVIVGTGPLEDMLKEQVRRLELGSHVTFTGFRSDIPYLLSEFDVFVHPSRWEGFGLVFLEAMSARLPVVATNVSAIPEIVVKGETGFLVPPESPHALASAMEQFINHPELCQSMGSAGYQRLCDQFSIDVMFDRYDRLYRSLLN